MSNQLKVAFIDASKISDYDTCEKWLIESNMPNPEKVALILTQIKSGIDFVYAKLGKTLPGLHFPKFGIVLGASEGYVGRLGEYSHKHNTVLASLESLTTFASIPADATITLRGNSDVITSEGTLQETSKLTGVEEGHHSFYRQAFGWSADEPTTNQADTLSVEEYDALPWEFAALDFQVQYGKELQISPAMLSILESRLRNANAVRKIMGQ